MMKRASHEDRLRLAGLIRNEVKDKLGDDLRAFVIFASTAKKRDRAFSDLELLAIVTDDYQETACGFMREGIYCEVYYVPYSKAKTQAGEVGHDWPAEADQWHRMLPIYVKQNDDCLGFIQTAAWQSLNKDDLFHERIVGAVFSVQEAVGSLMNSWEASIRSDVCTDLFGVSISTLYLVAFVNRYFYQSLRNAWEESKKLEKKPADYVKLIEIIHGETEAYTATRYHAALTLWANIQDWMTQLGIDWEAEGKLKFPKKVSE